ncbi:hypothetical protein [Fictibacillus terranigra]|uniref:Uncharacterized protein n=1 Tax=Fictibacillus terranigra TaxID=3058424 RepID=A0ABT8E600_9BACL|nr:hypothetical protein [Fictibacillus sp. CENA-BCM004]MDN4073335.1 hypothetical protein [Fictibacillus sp. CENA-BCM004]
MEYVEYLQKRHELMDGERQIGEKKQYQNRLENLELVIHKAYSVI